MDKQVKSRIKKLEKLSTDGIEAPKEERIVQFQFASAKKHGKRLIEAIQIAKSFDKHVLFSNSSFTIQRGERIGIIGPNGCGKTTLLQLILGKQQISSGELWISPSTKATYLSQNVHDLSVDETHLSLLKDFDRKKMTQVRTLLTNAGITEEKLSLAIKNLSMGEIMRFKLIQMMLNDYNLLIMDEPTNHLDIRSSEQLEMTLSSYQGTLLVVSHNRYLIEKLCETLLVFEKGKINKYLSGFQAYVENKKDTSKDKLVTHETNSRIKEGDRMIIENRISIILQELQNFQPGSTEYQKLDEEFKQLITRRKELQL